MNKFDKYFKLLELCAVDIALAIYDCVKKAQGVWTDVRIMVIRCEMCFWLFVYKTCNYWKTSLAMLLVVNVIVDSIAYCWLDLIGSLAIILILGFASFYLWLKWYLPTKSASAKY